MKEKTEPTCTQTWNPGEWPYVTRCVMAPEHPHNHYDRRGRSMPAEAHETTNNWADAVVDILTTSDYRSATLHRDKIQVLAMQWPTLASALAALVESRGKEVPAPLRRARNAMAKEGN